MSADLIFGASIDFKEADAAVKDFSSRIASLVAHELDNVLSVGANFEAAESKLTTLIGSSTAAKARMAELFDFAATTPFELDQVVDAEVTMEGFGANTKKLMGGLIDFSAATGADLTQMSVDIGKAWSRGAVGLRSDFGKVLRAEIEMREGTNAAKMSIDEFRLAMESALDEGRFAGGAKKLSLTFSGLVSNLKDEWTRFEKEVGDAGVFNNMKAVLSETYKLIGEHRDEVKALAGEVSGGLWFGFKSVAYAAAAIGDELGVAKTGAEVLLQPIIGVGAELLLAAHVAILLGESLDKASGGDGSRFAAPRAAIQGMEADLIQLKDVTWQDALTPEPSRIQQMMGFFDRVDAAAAEFGKAGEEGGNKAGKGFNEAGKGAEKAAKSLEKLNNIYENVLGKLEAGARSAIASQMSATDQIIAARDEELRKWRADYDEGYKAEQEKLQKGLISHDQYYKEVMKLDGDYISARNATIDAAGQKVSDELLKEEKARREAAKDAQDIVRGATNGQLTEVERLYQAKSDALDKYMEKAKAASYDEVKIAADRATMIAGYDKQIQQARMDQSLSTIGQIQDMASQGLNLIADAADLATQASVDTASRLTDRLAAIGQYLTDEQRKQMVEQIAASEAAAHRQWSVSAALHKADILGNAAVGAFEAIAKHPGPIGFAQAGLISAEAVVAVAQIDSSAPKFHSGGSIRGAGLAPDEVSVVAQVDEWMVNRIGRDTAGDRHLQNLNAGIGGGGKGGGEDTIIPLYVYRNDQQADRYYNDRNKRTQAGVTTTSSTSTGYRSNR